MAIFLEKMNIFGNFLTVKWQFSGGSAPDLEVGATDEVK